MAFNPAQPRQVGGKFGTTGAQKPTPKYKTAAAIPASAIPPQTMAQAKQIIAQQAAAVKSQGKLTPAQRLYLHQLAVARGIIMHNQATALRNERAALAAQKKAAAAQKRTAAATAATQKRAAATATSAAARGAAITARGQATASRNLARAQHGHGITIKAAPRTAGQSAKLRSILAQQMKRPLWILLPGTG